MEDTFLSDLGGLSAPENINKDAAEEMANMLVEVCREYMNFTVMAYHSENTGKAINYRQKVLKIKSVLINAGYTEYTKLPIYECSNEGCSWVGREDELGEDKFNTACPKCNGVCKKIS